MAELKRNLNLNLNLNLNTVIKAWLSYRSWRACLMTLPNVLVPIHFLRTTVICGSK
ncbi:hypothetical protein [Aeromonas jandaei]|uniref:hypothetical protein n=1 Tax=Aeromonas jandaei TaxID=650 RepID=UPI001ADDB1E3|nr:hypothetical protein [Aeromonas jandaei]